MSESLDEIGISEGTNKSSLLVDYLRHYERCFSKIKDDDLTIIEIGVKDGASTRTWARFFPRAHIVGIDTDPNCRRYANDRVTIEIGSQSDFNFLAQLCRKYIPDIIIDDGSHWANDVYFTFQTLFPFLRAGGFYVMEDLYLHYGESGNVFARDSPILPSKYMLGLADRMLENRTDPSAAAGFDGYVFQSVDRLEIVRNGLIIKKREDYEKDKRHDKWMSLVRKSDIKDNWIMLHQQLFAEEGSPRLAREALTRCMDLDPNNLHYHYFLADVLERLGDMPGAIAEARRAVELSTRPENVAAAQARTRPLDVKGDSEWRSNIRPPPENCGSVTLEGKS